MNTGSRSGGMNKGEKVDGLVEGLSMRGNCRWKMSTQSMMDA